MRNFLLIFCLLLPGICLTQSLIKSENGELILLNEDGTWDIVRIATLKDGTQVALKNDGKYQLLDSETKANESTENLNTGIGTGEYDGSGDGIFGRKVVYVNRAKFSSLVSDVAVGEIRNICIKACINNAGRVTYVELDESNTDVNDTSVLKKALFIVSGYKFEPDISAPREQCGVCLLYTSPSPRDQRGSRMPSSA